MSIVISLLIGTILGLLISKVDTLRVKGGDKGCVISSALGAYVFGGVGNSFLGGDILSFNVALIGFAIIGAVVFLFVITRLNKTQ